MPPPPACAAERELHKTKQQTTKKNILLLESARTCAEMCSAARHNTTKHEKQHYNSTMHINALYNSAVSLYCTAPTSMWCGHCVTEVDITITLQLHYKEADHQRPANRR